MYGGGKKKQNKTKKTWHLLNLYPALTQSSYYLFTFLLSLLITFYRDGGIAFTVMSETRPGLRLAAGSHPWGHLHEALTSTEYDGWGSLCVFVYVCECHGGHRSVERPRGLALQSNEPFQKGGGKTPSTSAVTHRHTHTHTHTRTHARTHTHTQKARKKDRKKDLIWWPHLPGEKE